MQEELLRIDVVLCYLVVLQVAVGRLLNDWITVVVKGLVTALVRLSKIQRRIASLRQKSRSEAQIRYVELDPLPVLIVVAKVDDQVRNFLLSLLASPILVHKVHHQVLVESAVVRVDGAAELGSVLYTMIIYVINDLLQMVPRH